MSVGWRRSLRRRLLPRAQHVVQRLVFGEKVRTDSALEPVYQQLFGRELAKLGIEDEFFPVGGAANYGMMYLVLRACCELAPQFILELGAGQTSLLFDRLRKKSVVNSTIVTVEHDPLWAARIGDRVSHRVQTLDLVPYRENGLTYSGYDIAKLTFDQPIDMLVIDGPPGGLSEQWCSRHGCLGLLKQVAPRDFIIIVDDVERHGEALLCERIDQYFRTSKVEFTRGRVTALKRQEIFASGRFLDAAYF